MTEVNVQDMGNLIGNKPNSVDSFEEKVSSWAISVLTNAAITVKSKFDREKSSNADRVRWGSLLVHLIHEIGNQVEIKHHLDELDQRIAKLEELSRE
jgi:hypothetical protein